MTTTRLGHYSLGYDSAKTYIAALLFAMGNIALPQLFHLIPGGGARWLPLFFFTLVGAYKCGLGVGLLTAILSPLVGSALFGMPASAALPAILIRSVLLALIACAAARRSGRISIPVLAGVVFSSHALGVLIEGVARGSLTAATQLLYSALPGVALQIFGGYLMLRFFRQLAAAARIDSIRYINLDRKGATRRARSGAGGLRERALTIHSSQ